MCADRLRGILSGPIDGPRRGVDPIPEVVLSAGLAVMHRGSRFRGAVVRLEPDGVVLRSPNTGLERVFSLHPGAFALNGETITLVRPRVARPTAPARTASGSIATPAVPARVAAAGRILVEGVHDAELVEKVWGDDLRVEGVVVERLDGVDVLGDVLHELRPAAGSRVGVLVDHLVGGSKESRIAAEVSGPYVLVTGTPFVDVWQAIRPSVVGIAAWPDIPRPRSWKEGMCEFFGEPVPGVLWKRLLSQVRTYVDLEPALVGAVESLIDFVTAGS
jgi:hypothetical protein